MSTIDKPMLARSPAPWEGRHLSVEKAVLLEQLFVQAAAIGPQTERYVSQLIQHSRLQKPMFGACRGILRLARLYGHQRMEAACQRALGGTKYNFNVIKDILSRNLDGREEISPPATYPSTQEHENIRGSRFFE
jgi:transposase